MAAIASRIAARSTTAGTPVKSCISTRAGRKAISRSERRSSSHNGDRGDVVVPHAAAVFVAQQILEQHLEREGQARDVAQAGFLGSGEAHVVVFARADLETAACLETVERNGHGNRVSPGGRPVTPAPGLVGRGRRWPAALCRAILITDIGGEIRVASPNSEPIRTGFPAVGVAQRRTGTGTTGSRPAGRG